MCSLWPGKDGGNIMEFFGVEVTLKSGEVESFDPVYEDDFLANDESMLIIVGIYSYEFRMDDVQSFRKYDLCPSCSREIEGGMCENSQCSNYIDA